MTKVSPPFKLDIAGAFCVPRALRDARGQYQDGQMSRQALRAIEDAEIRNLVERLKLAGVRVVSDGGFRNGDFLVNWEGILPRMTVRSPKGLRWKSPGESVCNSILFLKISLF